MPLLDDPSYRNCILRLHRDFPNWEMLNGKTVLLSGASGMIGSLLTDAIMLRNESLSPKKRCTVIAVARNESALRNRFSYWKNCSELICIGHDITCPLPVLPRQFDYLIHAASTTHPVAYAAEPVDTIMTNVLGAHNMLDLAAANSRARFLLLSSVEIYGANRGDADYFDERYVGYLDCNTLRAGYPEAKRVSEALCQAYIEENGVDAVILRLPRCFGPTMRMCDSKAVAQFIKNAAKRENIALKSDGGQLYSYAYVPDAVNGMLWTLWKGKMGEAYNLGSRDADITLRNLAELAAEHVGTKVVFEHPEKCEKKGYSTAVKALMDAKKLEALGWRARYGIEEALRETIDILERQTEESK